jgi:tRNA pseudouridine38-40 synthase
LSRIALGLSYNGAQYHGWQYQQRGIATVQESLQAALSRVANHPVKVTCAGRTDSGVHASSQIVHFDSDSIRKLKAWVMGTNALLPDTISVNWAHEVSSNFDARHSATSRRYLYLIVNRQVRSALMPELITREHRPLDASLMNEAAQFLLGENDFTSFRASNCQSKTAMRNIQCIEVKRLGDLVMIDVAANAFLHHMVRNITGVLLDIGSGEQPPSWTKDLLDLKDRTKASVTAPPNGLYLIQVSYPEHHGLPVGVQLPHLFANLPID